MWLQAIFSVAQPHGDIFLVVKIEKVLQGSVSGALDQYSRTDVKTGTKLHKAMLPYCQRLGSYHMPFAWGARLWSHLVICIVIVIIKKVEIKMMLSHQRHCRGILEKLKNSGFPTQLMLPVLMYDSEQAPHHSCCRSSKQDGSVSLGMWHGWATPKTLSEPYIRQPAGSPRTGDAAQDVHVTPGFGP